LAADVIDLFRRALRGETLRPVAGTFAVLRPPHHGHVQAVLTAMTRRGLAVLIAWWSSRERDLVVARVVAPSSRPATTRW
jgi:hypothetical protein